MACCCCCAKPKSDDNLDEEEYSNIPEIEIRDQQASSLAPSSGPAADVARSKIKERGEKAGAGGDEATGVNSSARWNIAVYEGDDSYFTQLLMAAEEAIEAGILPQRIYQGSSGSYFVKNTNTENIGVFKPRDEEPYGRMNPKWTKWFQRHCCPCCFGRGCLVPNSGYLSEAGASVVDFRLGLNVVPKTKVIRMASSTFHYGKIKRETARAKKNLADRFPTVGKRFHRIGLPLKTGSFQVFVNGYKDAIIWAQEFEQDPLPHDVAVEFQHEFERMVILDYVIRNTDRGNDNWLIRYDKTDSATDGGISLMPFSYGVKKEDKKRKIKIAAIDNGLAFPFKHPDEWRAYPFRWAKLPFAKLPFSEQTKDTFLPKLSNISLIEDICSDLYIIFSLDKNFKKSLFEKQMSVLRGQILNLANALRDGKSPAELVQMQPVRVLRDTDIPLESQKHESMSVSVTKREQAANVNHRTMKISPTNTLMFDGEEYKPEFLSEAPVFRSW